MVKSCFKFGRESLCVQDNININMDKCRICPGKDIYGYVFYDLTDYQYLIARSKLYRGYDLSVIEEYALLENNMIARNNLELLDSWLKNKQ